MKRKLAFLMALLIVAVIPMSGCRRKVTKGSEYAGTEYYVDENGEKIKINAAASGNEIPETLENPNIDFISWYDPGFDDSALPIAQAKAEYESRYGEGTINVEIVSNSDGGYTEKLIAKLAGGEGLEIIQVKTDWMPKYAIQNILQPVDGLINTSKFPYQGLIESMTWKGKHYVGFPNGMWSQVIWYNKTLFETWGVKTPAQYYKEGTWTWDNFLKAAQETTGGGVWGFSTLDLNMLVRSQPTGLVKQNDNGTMDITWNDPSVVNALQLTSDMIYKYKCWNPDITYASLNFKKGKVAMASGIIGFIQNFCQGMTDEIDVAPLPKPTESSEHYSSAYGIWYGIGAGCDNVEGAAAFLKILGKYECAYYEAGTRTPLERVLNDEQLKITRDLAANAGTLVDLSLPSWYPESANKFWKELSTENIPVATLLDTYRPLLQKSIDEIFK